MAKIATPKIAALRTANVKINYSATDGFSSRASYGPRGADPKLVIIEAIDELSRLAELFGFGNKALSAFQDAQERVKVWRAQQ